MAASWGGSWPFITAQNPARLTQQHTQTEKNQHAGGRTNREDTLLDITHMLSFDSSNSTQKKSQCAPSRTSSWGWVLLKMFSIPVLWLPYMMHTHVEIFVKNNLVVSHLQVLKHSRYLMYCRNVYILCLTRSHLNTSTVTKHQMSICSGN